MQIVTTGEKYTEIDGYACVIAYAEFQNLLGIESIPLLLGVPNQSITPSIIQLGHTFHKEIPTQFRDDSMTFAIMDISEPEYLPKFVQIDRIVTLFDHHFGFEKYWQEKDHVYAKIEKVGAAATLVFEEILRNALLEKMSSSTLLLLYTAIISNSLNLKATITDKRDEAAVAHLKKANLIPTNWEQMYFNEVSIAFKSNPEEAIRNDTKELKVNNRLYKIAQIELWNPKPLLQQNGKVIEATLKSLTADIKFLSSPSISKNKTHFVAYDEASQALLNKVFSLKFENSCATLNKLILRKEIIKAIQEY